MCDPVTAAMAAGSMKAAGSVIGGYQARAIARFNAAQQTADAAAEEEAAQVEATQIRKAGRYQVGAARAGFAGSGVNVDSGSAAVVSDEILGNVEHDAVATVLGGKRAAKMLRAQAQITRQQGTNAFTSGLIGAGGSLLETAGTVEKMKWDLKQKKTPPRDPFA